MQTLSYSAVYSMFGLKAGAFHVVQLLIHIANALILYWVLRRWFRPV